MCFEDPAKKEKLENVRPTSMMSLLWGAAGCCHHQDLPGVGCGLSCIPHLIKAWRVEAAREGSLLVILGYSPHHAGLCPQSSRLPYPSIQWGPRDQCPGKSPKTTGHWRKISEPALASEPEIQGLPRGKPDQYLPTPHPPQYWAHSWPCNTRKRQNPQSHTTRF